MCSFVREIIPYNKDIVERFSLIDTLCKSTRENMDYEQSIKAQREEQRILNRLSNECIIPVFELAGYSHKDLIDWRDDKKELIFTAHCRGHGYSLVDKK